ncbi:hypothetical protein BVRB_2g023610 [Beta vulgaris subsp. vulgaris]|nr:hypothetical protein BVRB_2g023610 [Beta vulgaris subsp. vulgaris]
MATSSSSQKPRHHLNHLYGGPTSAPPPTPSSTQSSLSSTSDSAMDTLSRLLHRLPPNLSLPTRRKPSTSSSSSSSLLPTLSLSSTSSPPSSTFELGYFQLSNHSITHQLAESAESDSVSLLELPLDDKVNSFPREWPLGCFYDDEENDNDHKTESFCLDESSDIELKLASLKGLTRELEKIGLEVVERLSCAGGFVGPNPKEYSTLMWVSSESDGDKARRVYPYVVGLQYQIRPKKWDLLSDSGLVNVEPQVGSVLVTIGDIAQVWSNGKLKKVRGRPAPISDKDGKSSLSMTLLLTLPLESNVSPLLKNPNNLEKEAYCETEVIKEANNNDEHQCIESISMSNDGMNDHNENQTVFNSFSFEDYAWRVYHERLLLKDPLDRYRVID